LPSLESRGSRGQLDARVGADDDLGSSSSDAHMAIEVLTSPRDSTIASLQSDADRSLAAARATTAAKDLVTSSVGRWRAPTRLSRVMWGNGAAGEVGWASNSTEHRDQR
jgi:hypothetical protein